MKVALTFLLTVFTATVSMAAGPVCKTIFASPEAEREAVEKTIKELSALRIEIDQKRAAGDSTPSLTALESDFYKKELAVLSQLTVNKVMTAAEYLERMRIEMISQQKFQKQQKPDKERNEEIRKKMFETIIGVLGIMHRIEPGSFNMGVNEVDVTLTKPFYMMETLTTQGMWGAVVKLANLRFGGAYNLNAAPSNNPGELHPVENVSYNQITIWLKALNRLSEAGDPALNELIPDHRQGDVYRLPTNAEWEFVARARGTIRGYYASGDAAGMKDYGWSYENSEGGTHQVGTKLPLVVDGNKNFYDMFGNAGQMMLDGSTPSALIKRGGVDLFIPVDGFHAVRGGTFEDSGLSYFESGSAEPSVARKIWSFRFIREERK